MENVTFVPVPLAGTLPVQVQPVQRSRVPAERATGLSARQETSSGTDILCRPHAGTTESAADATENETGKHTVQPDGMPRPSVLP